DANLLDASAALRTGGARGLRVAAAARASYLGETYGRYAPAGATALFPIPRYADAQLEAALDVGSRATRPAFGLASLERVPRTLGGGAIGLPDRTQNQGLGWWRAGLAYAERGEDDGLAATLYVGGTRATLDEETGAAPTSQTVDATMAGLRA